MPKMRRLTTYLAGSTALAAGVITWAFYERPNFYSAAVYLSQSNACLMVLANLALIVGAGFMYGLEQLLFGPLRPIEIEQLYERGWFAITEWLFAMSTFRDEFGVWFLLMFSLLFVAKVWGWIAEGRLEMLEQQPPANPKLFHSRLMASLALYNVFSGYMASYCFETVMYEARPGVMVMFVFEFAIIQVSAASTVIRYALWAWEQEITKRQIKEKVAEQKAAIRAARELARAEGNAEAVEAASNEDDVTEDDIEVPGWESKGAWLFGLDIGTDFLKLVAYMAFFTVLTIFYGIPIYIIRDMYLTLRSFTKRVTDYLKFQRATTDMNRRYPDATAQELDADNTCIVCREEMRPWTQGPLQGAAPSAAVPERQRPKRLPCGHILHFGCLRSWLERQQVCPICRRSVLQSNPARQDQADPGRPLFGQPQNGAQNDAGVDAARAQHHEDAPQRPAGQARIRRFQLGPVRFEIGAGDGDALAREFWQRLNQQRGANNQPNHNAVTGGTIAPPAQPNQYTFRPNQPLLEPTQTQTTSSTSTEPQVISLRQGLNTALINLQLNEQEAYLRREFQNLAATQQRTQITRTLFQHLEQARLAQATASSSLSQQQPQHRDGSAPLGQATVMTPFGPQSVPMIMTPFGPQPMPGAAPQFSVATGQQSMEADLPEGLVLPPGYTAVPLRSSAHSHPPPLVGMAGLQPPPGSHASIAHFSIQPFHMRVPTPQPGPQPRAATFGSGQPGTSGDTLRQSQIPASMAPPAMATREDPGINDNAPAASETVSSPSSSILHNPPPNQPSGPSSIPIMDSQSSSTTTAGTQIPSGAAQESSSKSPVPFTTNGGWAFPADESSTEPGPSASSDVAAPPNPVPNGSAHVPKQPSVEDAAEEEEEEG